MCRAARSVVLLSAFLCVVLAGLAATGCERPPSENSHDGAPTASPGEVPAPTTPRSPPVVNGAADEDAGQPTSEEIGAAAPPAVNAATTDATSLNSGTGEITFAAKEHDFGEIWDVEPPQHSFGFTNTGTGDLEILEIKPTCGCTATELDQKQFAPGEGSAIEVTFTPKGQGLQSKYIDVITDAGDGEPVRLTIKANVKAFAWLSPSQVRFENVDRGEEHRLVVDVLSADPMLALDSVKASGRHFSAEMVQMVSGPARPGDERPAGRIAVTLADDAPWGESFGTLVVECHGRLRSGEDTIAQRVTANMRAVVVGDLAADQTAFRFGAVPAGTAFERRIRLTRRSGTPFSVLGTEIKLTTMPDIVLSVEPVPGDPASHDVILGGDAADHQGSISGRIVLTTDVEGEEEIELGFSGIVRVN